MTSTTQKRCSRCGESKPLIDFSKSGVKHGKQRRNSWCKACFNRYHQTIRTTDPSAEKARQQKWRMKHRDRNKTIRRKKREAVLRHYGRGSLACLCCGEAGLEFLAIDHIHGGGGKHRRETGLVGHNLVEWLIRNGLPSGYRALCHNCNMARGLYGACPHEQRRQWPSDVFVHHLAWVDPDVSLGSGTQVWQFSTIRSGAVLGPHCAVGAAAFVGVNAKLGECVRLQHAAHVTDHAVVGDRVFWGNAAHSGNDRHPVVNNPGFKREPPIVEDDVSIGTGAVLLPGVRLGRGCVVGAGAVVTKDVPPYMTCVGNPARVITKRGA